MPADQATAMSWLMTLNTVANTVIGTLKGAKLDTEIGKFQQAILEANSYALATQQQQFSLASRVQELEKENTRLKDRSAEKEKYEVRMVADSVFAYVEKNAVGSFQNMQKFCTNCFEEGRKSFLQQTNSKGARGVCILLKCSKCNSTLEFFSYVRESQPPPPPATPINQFH